MLDNEIKKEINILRTKENAKPLIKYCEKTCQVLLENVRDDILSIILKNPLWWQEFKIARASGYYHGAFKGGLFCHSVLVAIKALEFIELFPKDSMDARSLIFVSLFHDLGKIGRIESNGDPIMPYYHKNRKKNRKLGSHAEVSIFNLQWLGIKLTSDEFQAIRWHDGAYATGFMENAPAGNEKPLQMCLHMADVYVSRILDV